MKNLIICGALLLLLFFTACTPLSKTNTEDIAEQKLTMVLMPIAINSGIPYVEKKYQAFTLIIGGSSADSEGTQSNPEDIFVCNYLIIISADAGLMYPMTLFNQRYKANKKFVHDHSIDVPGLLENGVCFVNLPRFPGQSDRDLAEEVAVKAFRLTTLVMDKEAKREVKK